MDSPPKRVSRTLLFDQNVAALRTHVDAYVETGVCIMSANDPYSVLDDPRIVLNMCSAMAKQAGRPFVYVSHQTRSSWLSMPVTGTKTLQTPLLLIGARSSDSGFSFSGADVQYRVENKQFKCFFQKDGLPVLANWLEMAKADRAMRAELILPRLP